MYNYSIKNIKEVLACMKLLMISVLNSYGVSTDKYNFKNPSCGPPGSLSVQLASSAVTSAWSVQKSRGDNPVRMWVQLKRWCVTCVCECYRGGILVMDVFWRRLCISMIWGRVIYLFWLGKGATSDTGKYLFRAANVWWRCAQYFVIASCG